MPVSNEQTLREGRALYFEENGLPSDGGYEDRWVVIRAAGIPVFAFPNVADRRRAVRFHDLHHVLTGYGTNLLGEAEIGAWELASGCTSSRAATVLNLQVFGFMIPFHRETLWQAFVRGRHSRNLYEEPADEALLERSVGEVRDALGVDASPGEGGPEDRAAFRRWCLRSAVTVWGPLLPIGLGLAWWTLG